SLTRGAALDQSLHMARHKPPFRRRASDRRERFLRFVRTTLTVLSLAVLAVVGWGAYFAWTPVTVPEAGRRFTVEAGATLRGVGRRLVNEGVLNESMTFVGLGRLLGKAGAVKAGIYELPERITPLALIEKFARGEVLQSEITIIEGWTFAQMRAALNAHPGVRHDTVGLSDEEVMQRVKVAESQPEGLFFPDTYHFNTGASDLQVLSRSYQTMQE